MSQKTNRFFFWYFCHGVSGEIGNCIIYTPKNTFFQRFRLSFAEVLQNLCNAYNRLREKIGKRGSFDRKTLRTYRAKAFEWWGNGRGGGRTEWRGQGAAPKIAKRRAAVGGGSYVLDGRGERGDVLPVNSRTARLNILAYTM